MHVILVERVVVLVTVLHIFLVGSAGRASSVMGSGVGSPLGQLETCETGGTKEPGTSSRIWSRVSSSRKAAAGIPMQPRNPGEEGGKDRGMAARGERGQESPSRVVVLVMSIRGTRAMRDEAQN